MIGFRSKLIEIVFFVFNIWLECIMLFPFQSKKIFLYFYKIHEFLTSFFHPSIKYYNYSFLFVAYNYYKKSHLVYDKNSILIYHTINSLQKLFFFNFFFWFVCSITICFLMKTKAMGLQSCCSIFISNKRDIKIDLIQP